VSKVNWTAPMKERRGVVGQPPAPVFWWYIKVYVRSGGAVTYQEGPTGMTLAQGLDRVKVLGQIYGMDHVVCGTYLGGYGGKSTYCSLDGGLTTTYGQPPPFPPAPAPNVPLAPLFPFIFRTPVVPFRPQFGPFQVAPTPIFQGYRTRVTWVGPSRSFVFGPNGRLGQDACNDLNNAVASAKASRNGLQQNLSAVNNAYNQAVAAGNQEAQADLYATKLGIQADIAKISADIVALEAQAKVACAPPPPSTGCSSDADCGAAGFKCVNGNCVPWDCFKDSDCPAGQRCDGQGHCIPIPASKASSSGAGGLFLLALGAAAAIFMGLKPPTLPKTAAGRLQENRRKRRRRR
jgi:Cys-rich repeat protein